MGRGTSEVGEGTSEVGTPTSTVGGGTSEVGGGTSGVGTPTSEVGGYPELVLIFSKLHFCVFLVIFDLKRRRNDCFLRLFCLLRGIKGRGGLF